MVKQRTYLCIDMKSFYASVECAERHLSPFETNLVVADESRGNGAITLAISPKMKSLGVKNRCRLYEIPKNMDYIIAMPRMSLYIKYCADIFEIYLDYFSPDDIHQYSIDEAFIDITDYLHIYNLTAKELAKKLNFTFRNLGIFICLSTGVRIGEICALTWEDIDTENGIIHIRKTIQRIYIRENGVRHTELMIDTPKTATSIRDIPMTKDLLSVLKPLRKVVNESFFVLTNDAMPTEPRTYRNYYKKLLAKLDIPPIKFHGLRHSFATRCIESHCDYKTVSVILGHSNISTTLNLYVHPNYEQKKKCIDRMLKSLK